MRTTFFQTLLVTSALTITTASNVVVRDDAVYTAESRTASSFNAGCVALTVALGPSKVFYPTSAVYQYENTQFWSNFQILSPQCVFRPTSAADVAKGIKTLKVVSGTFAVRGGAHMGIKGANNIDNGVLLVLSNLSRISLSSDSKVLELGPSHRWGAVYKWLARFDLSIAGGRLAPVGVPGLLLGGGISFFGNQVGWACDTIIKYEVVLASGAIVYPTKSNLPDLFWALKGGSSNFGIVTNFYIKTKVQKKIWAGIYTVGGDHIQALLEATANYSSNIIDPLSHIVPATLPVGRSPPAEVGAAILFYDSETGSAPDCFKPFFDIPAIASTWKLQTLPEFTDETGTAVVDHINNVFVAGTTVGKTYAELLTGIQLTHDVFYARLPLLYTQIPAANISVMEIVFQPIGSLWQAKTAEAGGNALGLDPNKIYIAWSQVLEWIGSEYDEAAYAWVEGTTIAINNAAKAAGVYDPFVYMGDATAFQTKNFYDGYGAANKAKLLSISRKYDPFRVFQKLLPGGFKIGY